MRSLAGRLEVVGGLDPFAQFDLKALTTEVFQVLSSAVREMDGVEHSEMSSSIDSFKTIPIHLVIGGI